MRSRPRTDTEYYEDIQLIEGIRTSLRAHDMECSLLDKSAIEGTVLLPHNIVIVEPITALMLQPGISRNEDAVPILEAMGEIFIDKSLTPRQKQVGIELLKTALREGKTVCLPWNIEGNHWVSVVMKNDTEGVTHIFYQDSFGHDFRGVEAGHERTLPQIQPVHVDGRLGVNLQQFLIDTFPGAVTHTCEIKQQDNGYDCGPVTALNTKLMVLRLNEGEALTIDNADDVTRAMKVALSKVTPAALEAFLASGIRRHHARRAPDAGGAAPRAGSRSPSGRSR